MADEHLGVHISVNERLDPRTLDHVQADEGRWDRLQPLIVHFRKMRRCSKRRLQYWWGEESRWVKRLPGKGMEWAGVVGGGERAYVRTGIARNGSAYIRGEDGKSRS